MTTVARVVAIVPAMNSPVVGETVRALGSTGRVAEVLVIDDASTDDTGDRAAAAGAIVITPAFNLGKGDAVALGVRNAPDATVYLLVDADLGATAAHVVELADLVLVDRADLVVAAFPPAAGRESTR